MASILKIDYGYKSEELQCQLNAEIEDYYTRYSKWYKRHWLFRGREPTLKEPSLLMSRDIVVYNIKKGIKNKKIADKWSCHKYLEDLLHQMEKETTKTRSNPFDPNSSLAKSIKKETEE
jgi:hypothetical protein